LNAEDYEPVVRFIEARAPQARRADTICYATKENQDAARELAADPEVALILVVGGKRSANTRHLWEICAGIKPSHWIQGVSDLDPRWFDGLAAGDRVVGLTAGASTPDYVVAEVEAAVQDLA
jgi:4-hydroxy-3-methylbut-2-enyl diphosphate reductase